MHNRRLTRHVTLHSALGSSQPCNEPPANKPCRVPHLGGVFASKFSLPQLFANAAIARPRASPRSRAPRTRSARRARSPTSTAILRRAGRQKNAAATPAPSQITS
jgi:hypothetical protein